MRQPTYFLSHGGGPWPWVPDWRQRFVNLEASLAQTPRQLPEAPKAVLVISGHWETPQFTVMSGKNPPMVYDYFGFPPHTYEITYPAPGDPALARRIAGLISEAGLPTQFDDARGYDHGAFVPLFVIYPEANVPVVQLSLQQGYDPTRHVALGRAVARLRDEGVLIIGSGLSYHNLSLFGPGARAPSEAFDAWLGQTLALPSPARTAKIVDWEKAPYARICHPREDHLAPLFVALGAAEGEPATRVYHDEGLFGGVTASSWRFG